MTNPNQPRFTVKRAIAAHLGEDEADIERERRYQPTRTPCAVYSINNDYLTASKMGRGPREADDNFMGCRHRVEIKAQGDGLAYLASRTRTEGLRSSDVSLAVRLGDDVVPPSL